MLRSGSSFLGSLFDQNPNFSYYFEPTTLFNFDRLVNKVASVDIFNRESISYKLEMLDDIFKCQIPYVDKYVKRAYDDRKEGGDNFVRIKLFCTDCCSDFSGFYRFYLRLVKIIYPTFSRLSNTLDLRSSMNSLNSGPWMI